MPYVKIPMPSKSRTNGSSRKGAVSRPTGIFFGVGFVLGRTVKTAIICKLRIMKAAVLIVQAYPAVWTMWLIMRGKITPPTDEPVTRMPMAHPRFLLNQVETQATAL
jgi:hypothetical protein